jgi:hypothetical protein
MLSTAEPQVELMPIACRFASELIAAFGQQWDEILRFIATIRLKVTTASQFRALNSSRSASTFLTFFSKFVTFFSVRPRRSSIWASVRSSAYSLLPCRLAEYLR